MNSKGLSFIYYENVCTATFIKPNRPNFVGEQDNFDLSLFSTSILRSGLIRSVCIVSNSRPDKGVVMCMCAKGIPGGGSAGSSGYIFQ